MARRRIEIEVLVDPTQARKGFRQSGQAAKIFGRDVERASRGAAAATLSFKGLGRSVAFASGAFLGGAGIVSALKSTINAAEESQRVLAQTQNAVKRSGESWAKYGQQIEKATLAQSQASGFDDERLSGTFSLFVRRTKDVNAALKLNATAMNVARGRNIELETAANLVIKASLGQAGALRRVGIDAQKGASAQQLLAMLNQKYAQSATSYANTAAGAQDRFRVALENFQEVLGAKALPTIAKYLNEGADWLNSTKNQQRVMGQLSEVVGTVKDVVAGLTPVVKGAASVGQKLSDALGGLRHVVELLLIAMAVRKVQGFAGALGMVGTRADVAAGKVGRLRGALGGLPAFVGITVGLDIIANAHTEKHGAHRYSGLGGWANLGNDLLRPFGQDWQGKGKQKVISGAIGPSPDTRTASQTHRSAGLFGTSGGGSAGALATGMGTLSRSQRNALALSMARTPGQELAALGEQRAILANQIRSVTRRLAGARGSRATDLASQLADLNDKDKAALSQIVSINESSARDATSKAGRVKDAAKKKQQALMDSVAASLGHRRFGVSGSLTLADVNKAVTKNEGAARQSAQFRALGLTGTGDALAPTRKALQSEAGRITKALSGTVLDTDKSRNTIARVRKLLSGQFGALTRETRMRMKDLLDALNPDENGKTGPLFAGHGVSLSKLTAGLPRAQALMIQQRLAAAKLSTMPGVAIGGGHHTTIINVNGVGDPETVAAKVTRAQKKKGRHTSVQIRGPYAGKQGL